VDGQRLLDGDFVVVAEHRLLSVARQFAVDVDRSDHRRHQYHGRQPAIRAIRAPTAWAIPAASTITRSRNSSASSRAFRTWRPRPRR
jgi:hypothetical protein